MRHWKNTVSGTQYSGGRVNHCNPTMPTLLRPQKEEEVERQVNQLLEQNLIEPGENA